MLDFWDESLTKLSKLTCRPESIHAENGEFHSFVYAGPMLSQEIPVLLGETVVRDQFIFADLMPAGFAATPSSL